MGKKYKVGEEEAIKLIAITPKAEELIAYCARVSSSNQDNPDIAKLLKYCIDHGHWSVFETPYITVEINTSRAISAQILRHRSFTFQEFSQRYQDVSKVSDEGMFEDIEIRRQATNNRQSSEEIFHPIVEGNYDTIQEDESASSLISGVLMHIKDVYDGMLEADVAREQARMILPMATKTRVYMTGSVRSWIHFIKLRDDAHAQKEAQEVARAVKDILIKELPIISKALGWKK